jgi:hypothetical protein
LIFKLVSSYKWKSLQSASSKLATGNHTPARIRGCAGNQKKLWSP